MEKNKRNKSSIDFKREYLGQFSSSRTALRNGRSPNYIIYDDYQPEIRTEREEKEWDERINIFHNSIDIVDKNGFIKMLHNHPRMEMELCTEFEVIVDCQFKNKFDWSKPLINSKTGVSDPNHVIVSKDEYKSIITGNRKIKKDVFPQRDLPDEVFYMP